MSLPIPVQALNQHIIALGKTGSGKSSTMRDLVEYILDQNWPATIVDPKGDWWGIKASATGKRAGYEVVIFGGDHADVPINQHSAAAVAELCATGNRPAIIDLGGWMPGERTRFWIVFASTFFKLTRGRRWLIIDEVHNFCPKGKVMDPDSGKMLYWSNRLASEGRGKGINLIAASQRPQKVHNDFLTSCETLIGMRVVHKADRRAYGDWIEGCGDPEKAPEVVNTLAQLKRGEGWVWSPEIEFGPKRIKFPMFKTYDSFKPQESGTVTKLKGWADVNLSDIRKKFETVIKEAEANDPEKLKAEIRKLRVEAAKKTPAAAPAVPAVVKQIGIPKSEVQKTIKSIHARYKDGLKNAEELTSRIETVIKKMLKKIPSEEIQTKEDSSPAVIVTRELAFSKKTVAPVQEKRFVPDPHLEPNNGDVKLRDGAQRMLAVLAQFHPNALRKSQMKSHAGLKSAGTFGTYLSDLKKAGFINQNGDDVSITSPGLAYCKHIPAAPTSTKEVLDIWKPKLRDGACRMLDILIEANGKKVPKEELMGQSNMNSKGTFGTYLSDLKTARLITVDRDGVAADKETLFL